MVAMLLLLLGCSSSRHVADGSYLLDKMNVKVVDSNKEISEEEMMNYVRQLPNHKILWSAKLQLGIYNMSGKDTTKWWNRWVRKIGEAPVVYSSRLTEQSADQLQKALINKGYLNAVVDVDTVADFKKKKISVTYNLMPGVAHTIRSIDWNISDAGIENVLDSENVRSVIREGDNLDRNRLESQREAVTRVLRDKGYYGFNKEQVTFNADTTQGSYDVDITINVSSERDAARQSRIRSVVFVTEFDPATMEIPNAISGTDTIAYRDINVIYGKKHYIRPSRLYENCYIHSGEPFRDSDVSKTYQALSRLDILNFVNIKFYSAERTDSLELLDAYVLLTPGKSQSVTLELEGTNSEGDLGVAAGVTYTHRNIGKGSETLAVKLRGAYESLSGNLDGFLHNRYMEYSTDASLTLPNFRFPFLSDDFKRKIQATTSVNMSFNYQERPEYTRIIATAGWSYKWGERANRTRHTLTPIDINYVYLPESTNNFIDEIAPDNPLLRYSYEDHFIMRLGYSFYHTNKQKETAWSRAFQQDVYTLRVNAETAGNLLFAINSIVNHRSNFRNDPYSIFGIRYSQYFKVECDYTLVHTFDWRNSLAFHTGLGLGYPYGNSTILPFEKRFYGGGANGVRGWGVRTLGPGNYRGSNLVSDFINQCGDIRLDLNLEYRAKLFWVLELGMFVDAGNIWTIHNYETQPGGLFQFNKFYKQIAASYGIGLRLDFSYFLVRFDLGIKAHNPALGEEPWPLLHPKWGRDSNFHFSIGYPF